MALGYYGHNVPQEQIVAKIWGTDANLPAYSGSTITAALSGTWRDTQGKRFRVTTRYTDLSTGVLQVNNDVVASELKANRPLIVGTQGHAMLVTSMTFLPNQMGGVGQVTSVVVRDPWPSYAGEGVRRELSAREAWMPTYLATVAVEDIQDEEATPLNGDSCAHAKDGVCDEPHLCAPGTDTTDCHAGSTSSPRVQPAPSAANGDSCEHANDGTCDEPEFCDPGTDSTDCRPKKPKRARTAPSYPTPQAAPWPQQPTFAPPQPTPWPQQPTFATACLTRFGPCSMAVRMASGQSCACPSPQGPIPGVSR